MNRRPLVRSLLASAAILAAIALAGCDTDSVAPSARSLQPLSPAMISEIENKNMAKESPILVRIFKEESELEVWKQDNSGRFALLKTYPICRWSGELGPKVKEGDRQAPEGFYTITPGLMNPNSSYYLAINTGFPNAYDRANGRTGNFLMIHGDCSSRGCYAMTDEQIAEIYALARESFFGGQRAFQIQAYPFRMTPLNMAKHRNSPHMAFWRMIKQGYDHFEVTRLEPKVDVCEKRYVFDAETKGKFSPAGACPAYTVNEDVVAAVKEKQQRDERQIAELVNRGTATVPVRMGTDGGMHPTFLAAFQTPYSDSAGIIRSPRVSLPGTIPPHARPPGPPNPDATTGSVLASPDTSRAQQTKVATAQPTAPSSQTGSSSDGFFTGLFSSSSGGLSRLVGMGSSDPDSTSATAKAKPAAKPSQPATAKVSPQANKQVASKPGAIGPQLSGTSKPAPQETNVSNATSTASTEPAPSNSASLLSGAQAPVPAGSFDNRWGSFR